MLDDLLGDLLIAPQSGLEVVEQDIVLDAVLVHDRREGEGPDDRLGVVVEHPAPRLVGLADLLPELAQHLAGLFGRTTGEEFPDLLQPLVVLDAEAADLPGAQLVERVDPERGSQDDLVEVAVREAVFVHVTKLGVRLEGLGQVLQDQASDVAVGVDQQRPTLVTGLLGQEVPQGDRQPCPWFTACFQVGVEEGQLRLVTGAIHQDELGGRVVSQVLVHFPKGEVPAAKQHGEPVLLGPAIDGPCPGPDHPLGIGEDDEVLALQGIERSITHCSIMRYLWLRAFVRMPHRWQQMTSGLVRRAGSCCSGFNFSPQARLLSLHRCVRDSISGPASQ